MAIETVTKRKSVINNGLPGIALLPYTDGLIQDFDRRRLADFYSLSPQVVAHNFWVPDRREAVVVWTGDKRLATPTWVEDQNATENFTPDKRSSTTWTEDEKPDDMGWKEETEVSLD